MKSALLNLGLVGLIGGGVSFASILARPPLTEPDAILELQNASLTTFQPSGATYVQDVRPQVGQRGVNVDGSLRASDAFGMACAGNPFGSNCPTSRQLGPVDLATGAVTCSDVDMDLPSPGFHWRVMRTYNNVQLTGGGSHRDSNGYQGRNWFQSSQPELLFYDADGVDEATDFIYLVYGADRFIEFKRIADSSDVFRATDGAAGIILHVKDASSEPDIYKYTDQVGCQYWFLGDDGDAGSAKGQLWKILDTAGETASSTPAANVTYVGDPTTASTAISSGYSNGKIIKAYDAYETGRRRYTYSYDATTGRLTQVLAETKAPSSAWSSPTGLTTVGQVNYTYYDGSTNYGNAGDLEFVKITIPQTDSGVNLIKRRYYRYYKNSYAVYNVLLYPGYDYHIRLIVDFEGCRNYDYSTDSDIDDNDIRSASDSALQPYAAASFQYDASNRVSQYWGNGLRDSNAGTGGGAYTISYNANGSYVDNSGYDEDVWKSRAIVNTPDANYLTQYFDEVSQPTHQVITDTAPSTTSPTPKLWATYVDRNAKGVVAEWSTPANITAYTHSSAALSRSTSAGLVHTYTLIGSGSTTEGFVSDAKSKVGTSGSAVFDQSSTYAYAADVVVSGVLKSTIVRPLLTSTRRYAQAIGSGTTGSSLWSYSNTMHSTTSQERLELAIKEIDTTLPAVSTANNGSNSSNTLMSYFNPIGTLAFEKSALGYITYHANTNGQPTTLVEDANTSSLGVTIPSGFTSSSGALHHITSFTYDAQGRFSSTTVNSYTPTNYYTVLADGRQVILRFTHTTGSPTTYYGPVGYTIANQAGLTSFDGLIALTGNSSTSALTAYVDESDVDPITAIHVGTVARMTTDVCSPAGTQVVESRAYFQIPTSVSGLYDSTAYNYDASGRLVRRKDPSGTINTTVFDLLGRQVESWIGTDDAPSTSNMVRTELVAYDSGNDKGDSHVTQRTLFVEDSTSDQRVTTYTNDEHGWPVIVASPLAPYSLTKFDHCGRVIASGLYNATSGLSATSDPTIVTTNRLALTERKYDELGRSWRTIQHKITASTGASADSLSYDSWFSPGGQLIKTKGSRLEKVVYDRLGRVVNDFVLAQDDDGSTYANMGDAAGDVVLQQSETTYDPTDGKIIMCAVIQRNHDDVGTSATTGPLDTNADGDLLKYSASDIKGRIQITTYWNSLLGVTDVVQFGTYGGTTFNRSGLTVPSRSPTAIRSSYSYDSDGSIKTAQDPQDDFARLTRYVYDQAGRKTAEILNYDGTDPVLPPYTDSNGQPWNVTTRYAYLNGLMVTSTRDLPTGESDQVTTYSYGTTKGTSPGQSKVATGHLLQQVSLPDSTGTSDATVFAYNAQAQEVWRREPQPSGWTGTVLETDYDLRGRLSQRRVTTTGTGVDPWVLLIGTTYTDLNQVARITQYDDVAGGSTNIVNEVMYQYDGWGNLLTYGQDPNSAVGASGSEDDYRVTYAYAKAAGAGWQTTRRTSMATSVGSNAAYKTISYSYSSTDRYDDDVSRVTRIKDGTTTLARYDYMGIDFVVGDNRPEPDIYSHQYSSTSSGTYPDLDNFNRCTTDRWTKSLVSQQIEFFRVHYSFDPNSRQVSCVNDVLPGFDVQVVRDNLARITEARRGTLTTSGGSTTITNPNLKRDEQWQLTHVGNWTRERLDLNGDGVFTGSGERDDKRGYSAANVPTTRDLDNDTNVDATVVWSPTHDLLNDGIRYTYTYDSFHRLVKVYVRGSSPPALVEQRIYDGEGNPIAIQYDNSTSVNDGTPNGIVDGNDTWFWSPTDECGDEHSLLRGGDTAPKAVIVRSAGMNHPQGLGKGHKGGGGGTRPTENRPMTPQELADLIAQIVTETEKQKKGQRGGFGKHGRPTPKKPAVNSVVCVKRDPLLNAPPSGLNTTYYVEQDQYGSVVNVVDLLGHQVDSRQYSLTGTSFGIGAGDFNCDGACTPTDAALIGDLASAEVYDPRADLDLNGSVTNDDVDEATDHEDDPNEGEDSKTECVLWLGFAGCVEDPVLTPTVLDTGGGDVVSPELGCALPGGPGDEKPTPAPGTTTDKPPKTEPPDDGGVPLPPSLPESTPPRLRPLPPTGPVPYTGTIVPKGKAILVTPNGATYLTDDTILKRIHEEERRRKEEERRRAEQARREGEAAAANIVKLLSNPSTAALTVLSAGTMSGAVPSDVFSPGSSEFSYGEGASSAAGAVEAGTSAATEANSIVLGRYPGYQDLGAELGANYLDIPTAMWNAAESQAGGAWAEFNDPFLEWAASNDMDVILSSGDFGGNYLREAEAMLNKYGYVVDDGSSGFLRLVAPWK